MRTVDHVAEPKESGRTVVIRIVSNRLRINHEGDESVVYTTRSSLLSDHNSIAMSMSFVQRAADWETERGGGQQRSEPLSRSNVCMGLYIFSSMRASVMVCISRLRRSDQCSQLSRLDIKTVTRQTSIRRKNRRTK
jgi:hypothetical protein